MVQTQLDIGNGSWTLTVCSTVDADTKGTVKGADGALVIAGGLAARTTVTGICGRFCGY